MSIFKNYLISNAYSTHFESRTFDTSMLTDSQLPTKISFSYREGFSPSFHIDPIKLTDLMKYQFQNVAWE